jgi:outer membrane protein assembly factor BamB
MYNIETWAFTDVEDRRRYTDYDMPGANERDDYTGTEHFICPGNAARNWQNDSWNPQTGLFYVSTDNSCFTQVVLEGEYVAGEGYTLRRGAGNYPGGNNRGLDGEPTDIPGQITAMDPVAGETAFTIDHEVGNNVPVFTTAGGLLFQGGGNDGRMHAYNAATGEELWSFRTGSQFSQSAISYIGPDGRQYIAIIASASNTSQVNFDDDANDNARYRRAGSTLYVWALPQTVAGGM